MKLMLDLALAIALCAPGRAALLRSSAADVAQRAVTGTSLRAKVGYMVQDMFRRKDTTTRHIARTVHKKMKLSDALPLLEDKLPKDVTSLLHLSSGEHAATEFSEVSLAKGRVYLNNMMYDAWLQLDQLEVDCKEFEESNRQVFSQVVTDLEHLGAFMADQQRMKVEAEGGVADMDTRILGAEGNLDKLKREFHRMRQNNAYILAKRQDDLDVFTAILQLSKCPNDEDDTYSMAQFDVCRADNGTQWLEIHDKDLAARVRQSPQVEKSLMDVLGQTDQGREAAPQLLQVEQAPPSTPTANEGASSRKCTNGVVNCGYLHDIMALEWGKYKDSVDELTYIMQQNRDEYEGQKDNMNEQISTLRSDKMKFTEMLSEAVSEINALTAASRQKQEQHRETEKAYKIKMAECKKEMSEILYTN